MEDYPHLVNHSRKEIMCVSDEAEKDIIAAICYAFFPRRSWTWGDIIELVTAKQVKSVITGYRDAGYQYFNDRVTGQYRS